MRVCTLVWAVHRHGVCVCVCTQIERGDGAGPSLRMRRRLTPTSTLSTSLFKPPSPNQLAASTATPADYLAALPPAPDYVLAGHPIAAAEIARAASGAPPPPPGLDTSRYRLDPPTKATDLPAWRAALDNARAQLEHQAGRLLNLELLAVHGPRAAAASAAHVEAALKSIEREAASLRAESEAVNRARKLAHQRAAAAIEAAEAEWAGSVRKCEALTAAVSAAEAEVAAKKPAGWGEEKPTGLPELPRGEEDGVVEMDAEG